MVAFFLYVVRWSLTTAPFAKERPCRDSCGCRRHHHLGGNGDGSFSMDDVEGILDVLFGDGAFYG